MLFKRLIHSITLVLIVGSVVAQIPKKKYKWKAMGPFTTPPSNVDSGDWTSTGMGWIEDVLIADNWYAGSITGGLYYSRNEGNKWKKLDSDSIQMGTLAIEKVGNTIFRATGLTHYDEKFGLGILKSENNGRSWQNTGLTFKPTDLKPVWVLQSLRDSTLIACTPNQIYTSKNFGESWTKTHQLTKGDLRTVVSSADEKVVFAAGSELLLSHDKGLTWETITKRLPIHTNGYRGKAIKDPLQRIAICNDSNTPQRFLAFYSYGREAFIDESSDYGETWTNIHKSSRIRRGDIHHIEIAIPPNNPSTIVLGTYRTYISRDYGKTFKVVTQPEYRSSNFAHDDIRGMHIVSANEFYLATDGGVFQSTDTGHTWVDVSGKGLNAMQIYGISLLQDGRVVVGCQDLGTFVVKSKKDWLNLGDLYGDGGDTYELRESIITQMGGTLRLTNKESLKGLKFIHPPYGGRPFTSTIVPYPGAMDSFFYVGTDLWYNNSSKWTNLTKPLRGGDFKATGFDINLTAPNQLFFAYDQPTWDGKNLKNKFFKSIDTGNTWKDITTKLPILSWRHVKDIATNPQNPNEVYVALGTMDVDVIHKVYKSMDGGDTWENYSRGLTNLECFKIVYIPNSTGKIVSTIDGIYYRNNEMQEWQKMKGRLPNIAIRDFEIDYENRWLYAGTYGNGLWKMKIPKKMLRY
jgi:photosystem II stability/assembly factor-like uncharacterized protein